MVFLKEFFEKVDFEKKKNQQTTKKHANLPSRQRVNDFHFFFTGYWVFIILLFVAIIVIVAVPYDKKKK